MTPFGVQPIKRLELPGSASLWVVKVPETTTFRDTQRSPDVHLILCVHSFWVAPPQGEVPGLRHLYFLKYSFSTFLTDSLGRGGHMRETGAICQIGVLTWKRCILGALKGPSSSIWRYKNCERPFQLLRPFGAKQVFKRYRPHCSQMLCLVVFEDKTCST